MKCSLYFRECVNFNWGAWQNSFWSLYHCLLKIIFWCWLLWLGILSYRMAKFAVKMVFSIPAVVAFVLLSSIIPGLYSWHLSPARLTSLIVTVWAVCTSLCHLPLESHSTTHQCVHFATLCSILGREDETQRQLENRLLKLSSFQSLEKWNSSEKWDCNFKTV